MKRSAAPGGSLFENKYRCKQIRVKYNDMWRVENGELVENWVQMDMLSLMQQLGVAPAPG